MVSFAVYTKLYIYSHSLHDLRRCCADDRVAANPEPDRRAEEAGGALGLPARGRTRLHDGSFRGGLPGSNARLPGWKPRLREKAGGGGMGGHEAVVFVTAVLFFVVVWYYRS